MLVFGAVSAVDFVIGIHNRPGLALFDGDFKACQINFAQGSFVNNGIAGHSAGFLAVGGKVLEGSADSL